MLCATSSVFASHLCIYILFKCNKNRLCELLVDSSFNCLSHRLKRLLLYCIKKLKSQHTLERQMWIPLNCSLFSVLACGNAALPLVAVKGILFVMKQIFWSVTCCQSGFNHQVLLACIWPVTPVNCALFRPSHCLMTESPFSSAGKSHIDFHRSTTNIRICLCRKLGLCLSGHLEVALEDIYYRTTLALVQSLISCVQSGLAEQRLNRLIDPLNAFGHWFLLCPWEWQSTSDPRLSITQVLKGRSSQCWCIFCWPLFLLVVSWVKWASKVSTCEESVTNSNGVYSQSLSSWCKVNCFSFWVPLTLLSDPHRWYYRCGYSTLSPDEMGCWFLIGWQGVY